MDTSTSTSFYFNINLAYIDFITEATKQLHSNSSFGTLCLVIAHTMWSSYKVKSKTCKLKNICITVKQKDFQNLKPPSCQSLWIMCEEIKNVIPYPNTNPVVSCKPALDQIYKQGIKNLPTDFEFYLVSSQNNPVMALYASNAYRASKVK